MNFQEWYKTMPKLTEPELRISVISWDACKKEVLKILKDNQNNLSCNGSGIVKSRYGIIKEIENL